MQQRFLPTVQNLDSQRLLTGLWLIHSDEPLTQQWFIDACRPSWHTHAQIAKRTELTSAKSWQAVVNDLHALSLFAESSAIIITGKQKLDETTLAELSRFADDARHGNTSHQLIWLLPKQDKKSQNTKAFKLFDTQGTVIDANIYNEKERFDLLKFQATKLGLMLEHDAWQALLSHTEHDLLAAYQNLWRLSYLHAGSPDSGASDSADHRPPPLNSSKDGTPTTISLPQLIDVLNDGGRFSVFDLSDVILAQNTQQTLKIIKHLQQTDTAASITLWALAKDVRLISGIQSGKDPMALGIWRNKTGIYQRAAQFLSPMTISQALIEIYEIDKAIKGLSDVNPWQQIRILALQLCGVSAISHPN